MQTFEQVIKICFETAICDNITKKPLFRLIDSSQKCNLRDGLWKEGIGGAVDCWVTSYLTVYNRRAADTIRLFQLSNK
jgi:hypothetical protein